MGEPLVMILVGAVVQACVGLAFWFAVQRNLEKVDRLEREIKDLRDKQVKQIEDTLTEHTRDNVDSFTVESTKREKIYSRLDQLDRTIVTRVDCHETHKELAAGLQEFRGGVLDLARVQTKIEGVANFVNEVNQRVLGLVKDVAKMEGNRGN